MIVTVTGTAFSVQHHKKDLDRRVIPYTTTRTVIDHDGDAYLTALDACSASYDAAVRGGDSDCQDCVL